MFDVGFWELTIIAVVALLVIGPERSGLPPGVEFVDVAGYPVESEEIGIRN